jgi:hypothetical protein
MQLDSLFAEIESLKLPAALLIFAGIFYMKFRNLEKTVHDMNVAKEDKTVVAQLTSDLKEIHQNKEEKTVVAQLALDLKGLSNGKEDKHVVEKLVQDFKGLSMRHNDAIKKADQRARVHELTIVALAPEKDKHQVIADLKGD